MTSDEALMLKFQRGSREAFEELFARYRGPLYGFFRRRLQISERAEDLTQETFLAVIRATSRYEPRSLVRTYLYGIAMNLLAAERRKQAKDPPAPEPSEEPRSADAPENVLWVRRAPGPREAGRPGDPVPRGIAQPHYAGIPPRLPLSLDPLRPPLFP